MVPLCREDFNKLKVSRIQNAFDLKPVVKFSIRGRNILDLLLTDLNKLYDSPRKLPPFSEVANQTIVTGVDKLEHPL